MNRVLQFIATTLLIATCYAHTQETPSRYIIIEKNENPGLPEDIAVLSPGERRYAAVQRSEYDKLLATMRLSKSSIEKAKTIKKITASGLNIYIARDLIREESPELKIWGITVLRKAVLVNNVQQVKVNPKNIAQSCKLLVPLLTDCSAKVRFFSSLLLYKITGNNYSYHFNDRQRVRDQAAALWAQSIAKDPILTPKK